MWGSYREEEEIDSGYCSCVIAINCFLTRGAKDLEFSKFVGRKDFYLFFLIIFRFAFGETIFDLEFSEEIR